MKVLFVQCSLGCSLCFCSFLAEAGLPLAHVGIPQYLIITKSFGDLFLSAVTQCSYFALEKTRRKVHSTVHRCFFKGISLLLHLRGSGSSKISNQGEMVISFHCSWSTVSANTGAFGVKKLSEEFVSCLSIILGRFFFLLILSPIFDQYICPTWLWFSWVQAAA